MIINIQELDKIIMSQNFDLIEQDW